VSAGRVVRRRSWAWATVLAALSGCATAPTVRPLPQEAQATAQRYVVVTVRNPADGGSPRAASTPRGYDAVQTYGPSTEASVAATSLARDFRLHEVSSWPIRVLGVHCIVYLLPDDADATATIAALAHDPRVDSVQPLLGFSTLESRYNDPYRSLQHNLDQLAVEQAHAATRGAGVRIAVIDTGVDTRHPDLDARRIVSRDFVGAAGQASAERHGTEVAGIIAALTNNGRGIAGIAPAATLYALKACWHPSPGAAAVCNSFTLAQALAAALDVQADIVNLSLAGPADPLLTRLVDVAVRRGVVVVAAVAPGDPPGAFPARLPGVLAVDTSESANPRAGVLLAPGRGIPTLVPGSAYDIASGSSLATAEVSGTVALMRAARPDLTAAQIRHILQETTRDMDVVDARSRSIDACGAVASVVTGEHCSALPTPVVGDAHMPVTRLP
jgi:subtilisin family serine protease